MTKKSSSDKGAPQRSFSSSDHTGQGSSGKKRDPKLKPPVPMAVKLRRKFVLTAMGSLFIILVLLISFINVSNLLQIRSQADGLLAMLVDNNGAFPDRVPPSSEVQQDGGMFQSSYNEARDIEVPFMTRYFYVRYNAEGTLTDVNVDSIAAVTRDTAISYGDSVLSGTKEKGYIGSYRYRTKAADDGSTLIVFVDCSSDLVSATHLLMSTLYVGAAALILMFILVWIFSSAAVAPVVESIEKQKQFISDAGHELKTPLAIISANVDVLEMTGTKNEWTKSIRNQVKRMTALITNLLTLTRMEEERSSELFLVLDLSRVVRESVETYETVAEAKNKSFSSDIQDGICVFGEVRSMEQLCGLLLDNAMKYSDEEGSIHVSLSMDKKVRLEVSNTCEPELLPQNPDRLFDRFYRADTSRKNSGSFGIGLSAARAICTRHGGSITAERDGDRTIRFIALLPPAKKQSGETLPA